MIISHAKRFVVLRPWKTASNTLTARLTAYCESPYSAFYDFNPFLNRVVHQHLTYGDFRCIAGRAGSATESRAFVRNPYATGSIPGLPSCTAISATSRPSPILHPGSATS